MSSDEVACVSSLHAAKMPTSRAPPFSAPTLAVEAAIHSLEPRLPEMRRALADARGWLGYGDADRGPAYNSTAGAAAQPPPRRRPPPPMSIAVLDFKNYNMP